MSPGEMQNTLAALMDQVLPMLAEHGFEHHCIEAAALLTKALHEVGIRSAYPLTVGVRIINEACRQYVDAHGIPSDEASRKAFNDAGTAIIMLGKEAPEVPEGNWQGHLVVIVPEAFGSKSNALLDSTITQADRPEWGIKLQPLCLKVTDDFVAGRRSASFEVNRTLLIYHAYPDDRSYNDHGDCMKKDGLDEAVSIVIRGLKG